MSAIDWTQPMIQSFEYYIVDPISWRDTKKIDNVKSSSITRDSTVETLGSATIDIIESVGECYVRTYLIAVQNGIVEKVPLGTHLVQTPSSSYNGKTRNVTMDAYTPLIELKENPPELGYSILKDENIMERAYQLTRENVRAPVIRTINETNLTTDFVSQSEDTWISFLTDLIANAKHTFDLDEMGRILYSPIQDTASLQPVWTFTDDNSSILLPEITLDHDLFDIPNVVEVIYTSGRDYFYSKVVNDDVNSPTSTVNRGRIKKYRAINPSLGGIPTQAMIDEYANRLMKNLSTVEYTVKYSHGYCPVRPGDCVRLNYKSAGIVDVKAKVTSQSIKCDTGCTVSETAVFTSKLWG